ncbi:hypothetical protein TWF694_002662 [Orbilia ellipsospora]|uniref:DUF6314 domain-containing protein n=1 Tax=Orbilia ellipsospora TaxID=2528407 RepID=A0AAV9X2N8_9PEZI
MTTPQTIFNALRGTWTLHRTLTSAIPSFPSGTFTGTATLTPHPPSTSHPPTSLLYSESGELKTDTGLILRANKKYIYQYDEKKDKISAWFVKEPSSQTQNRNTDNTNPNEEAAVEQADYLFHELILAPDSTATKSTISDCRMTATGDHLCIKDNYAARYAFEFENGELKWWSLRYNVSGPSKDYISSTVFRR